MISASAERDQWHEIIAKPQVKICRLFAILYKYYEVFFLVTLC